MNILNVDQLINLDKLGVFRHMYANGYVKFHLDARTDGVVVPDQLKHERHLKLWLGANLPIPTKNVRVNKTTVSAVLYFSGQPFLCIIPWASVFALVGQDDIGVLWVDGKIALLRRKTTAKLNSVPGSFTGCDDEVDEWARANRAKFQVISGGKA